MPALAASGTEGAGSHCQRRMVTTAEDFGKIDRQIDGYIDNWMQGPIPDSEESEGVWCMLLSNWAHARPFTRQAPPGQTEWRSGICSLDQHLESPGSSFSTLGMHTNRPSPMHVLGETRITLHYHHF